MITVNFHGRLKDDFGGCFVLDAAGPYEALHALFVQLDGLREAVRPGFFTVCWNGRTVAESEAETVLSEPGSGCLDIVPVAAGAGKVGQIVAGVALIAVAWWNPAGWFGAAAVTGMYAAGIGMVVGGVAQFLMRPPKTDLAGTAKDAGRNSAFSNLDNTAAQGRPVPLAYGLVYCGSRVVSQGVESRRLNGPEKKNAAVSIGDVGTHIFRSVRKFGEPAAAQAPDGGTYALDKADDSVRARNYTAGAALED